MTTLLGGCRVASTLGRTAWAVWLIGLAGCSGDSTTERSLAYTGSQPVAASASGNGGVAGASGGAGFGNSTVQVGSLGAPAGDGADPGDGASDDCEVGAFCMAKSPDPDNCGTIEFVPEVEVTQTPGNVLVVFDQSMSMNELWDTTTGVSKLIAARDALSNVVSSLGDLLTVGALFFPTVAGCFPIQLDAVAVESIAGGGQQIPFQAAPDFLVAWDAHWASASVGQAGLGTPLQEAFDRADEAIAGAMLDGPLAVLVFTDGAPTCFPPLDVNTGLPLSGLPTMPEAMRAADWLTSRGVKTYVVGLPGAAGVQLLNDVAGAGGTGQYIVPDDPAALEATLREVVQETVNNGFASCAIGLDPVPDVPDELLMLVEDSQSPGTDRQQVPRERGWSLTIDGDTATVELSGSLCDAALGGRFSSITFEYACPDAPPPPTLPPLE